MCLPMINPITLAILAASTAASAGGAAMNASTQNNAIEAQNRENARAAEAANVARQAEAARQMDMEQQQAAEVTKALMEANPVDALARAQKTAAAPTNPVVAAADYNTPAPTSGGDHPQNRVIDEATAGYAGESAGRQKEMVDALALLTALNSGFAGTNDAIGRSGSNIATTGVNRRGSLQANQLETSIPGATITPGGGIAGDLLMLGGQAGSMVAGGRLGAAAGEGGGIGDMLLGLGKKGPKHPVVPQLMSGGIY